MKTLSIKNFSAKIGEKTILKNVTHEFKSGKTTAILGHNGSGKSSLALAIMWHPRYETSGEIFLDRHNIDTTSTVDRHHSGIFLSFQNIPEIPWIKVIEYLRTIYNAHFVRHNVDKTSPSLFVFRRLVEKLLPVLHIDTKLLDRDLFVGFSGGEKRKIELLQITLLNPEIIILDEIDSGLDIDALSILTQEINKWHTEGKTVIIISHNLHLLDKIDTHEVIVMKNGEITEIGDANLLKTIEKQWFNK